jgi:hypothetical protein
MKKGTINIQAVQYHYAFLESISASSLVSALESCSSDDTTSPAG